MTAPSKLSDQYDAALLGIARRGSQQVFVYSESAIISLLMEDDDLDEEDAYDYFYSNILVMGQDDGAPFFLADFMDAEDILGGTD